MSKRRKKNQLDISENFSETGEFLFSEDHYQAPKGKKPRGKQKRRQSNHKTAYYD